MTSNVIVTGGTRGLGANVARTLALSGYSVIAIARRETEQFACMARQIGQAQRGSIHFAPFDLADTAGLHALVREIRSKFGPIFGLVNNAGIGATGVLATMHDVRIEQLVRLNTISPLLLTKYVVRVMMADGGGRIVNMTSIVASTGYSGLSVYSATKASLVGFTRSLARELGVLGINVNAVAPGFVDTDMTQSMSSRQRNQIARRSALHRLIATEDVANAVEFLLSERAKNITGTVLTVDAGNTA